jgi:acyl-CoA synthetase (AMP-forming)/AMP-acid ligase II
MRKDPSGFLVRLDDQLIDNYVKQRLWSGKTLGDHARSAVAEAPDATLLIDADRLWTRAEIFDRACRLGESLRKRGLKLGDVVSFQLPNWHEAAIVNLTAALYGFITNPIVPIQRDMEVTFSLSESRSKIIFVPGVFRKYDYAAMMERIDEKLPEPIEVVVVRSDPGEFTAFEDLLREQPGRSPAPVDPNNVKMLMYTSGTTGHSKGVLQSHNTMMAEIESYARYWGLNSADIVFMASPVSHIAGANWALELPWIARASAVLMDFWTPDSAVELINKYKCTITSGATVFLEELIRASEKANTLLPSLRMFVCGGAPIPPSIVRRAYEAWPHCLTVRVYGSTEASSVTYGTLLEYEPEKAATTDGKICNWDVKICDSETGRKLGAGEEGEIFVRGPELFLGYIRPEDSEASFDAEGYFGTGDIGRIVEDNYLVITDRKKDLIIRGGENISAREIEDALVSFPGIQAVAAVAMPCPRMGETVCVFVETNGVDITKEEIAQFMIAKGIARQKIPERVERIQILPRTASGKIRKGPLRDQAAKLVGANATFQKS